MTLPKQVRIMGISYDVLEVDKLLDEERVKKLDGNIRYTTSDIQIEKELSAQMKEVTLWHEIIHGLLTQTEMDCDEKLVSVLGYGIAGFINDNPSMFYSIKKEK